ncbi:Uncharacterised protein [Mycolicibacterium flavescens]|uniref:hypothetical protein n=1 Tax=Mycobacterium neumannii TaxID=2048551 RepID=UPI000F7098A6|nr:hypothetical protein [Mycobacterium neumannii]VEG42726.1 Uncharacterised protein [Mycolicibacterium flavescens]
MKRTVIRARRTLADGRRLLQVVCPYCDHRHWLPDAVTGFCNRRNYTFTIPTGKTNS